ncbi:MAG: PEGA domain-containing protein, partial [Candidatus Neomarinimicrobiota bacterium]|nr:PEGA domain-containing protein [Candidatus Neomarinimicrobiota bacterium]
MNQTSISDVKAQQKYINKESPEDLAAYSIIPNLDRRKTYLKIGCDLTDVYIYLDGKKVGKTPLTKKVPVSSGWHRIRFDIPGAKKFNESGIPIPDYRDVYVTKGRTQKATFKFLDKTEENPG